MIAKDRKYPEGKKIVILTDKFTVSNSNWNFADSRKHNSTDK